MEVIVSAALPQCSDNINNDSDELIDILDPTCHTDGDPNNPTSYDPLKDSEENTKPVITLTGTNAIVTVGGSYTDLGATANDAEDGDITANITASSTVNTSVVGNYTVKYNVKDAEGLAADEVSRMVEVIVSTPPVCTINCGGGGGGGPVQPTLRIFNEKLVMLPTGAGMLTWKTDKPATSRVVYDLKSQKKPNLNSQLGIRFQHIRSRWSDSGPFNDY